MISEREFSEMWPVFLGATIVAYYGVLFFIEWVEDLVSEWFPSKEPPNLLARDRGFEILQRPVGDLSEKKDQTE